MYWNPVWAFVFSHVHNQHLTDDLTQDIFVTVLENVHKVRDTSRIKSWLFTVAKNKCSDHYRSAWIKRIVLSNELEPQNVSAETIESHIENNELWSTILGMKKIYREVIILRMNADMSFAEIADVLHIPAITVRVRYRRALQEARKLFVERGYSSEF